MAYYETYMPNESGELQKVVYNCDVGFCLPYYGETAPPGTLLCDGSEISREAYKELFQVLGTKAGAGDGVSTFNLPDFRGQFVRGVGGNAAALGVSQGDAIRNIMGTLIFRGGGSDGGEPDVIYSSASGAFSFQSAQASEVTSSLVQTQASKTTQEVSFAVSYTGLPVANENRPTNTALLWCIIYE